MRIIIDVLTKEEVKFSKTDLPILIHGKEHSGASLLSITVAALLHKDLNKLLIFTAYPMAREEFLKQIDNSENIFYLEKEEDLVLALKYQTIFIQSGNIDLFIKTVKNIEAVRDRIIFIKNIETINIPIYNLISTHPFMVSGDFESNLLHKDFINLKYNNKIIFNKLQGEEQVSLEKYQAFVDGKIGKRIITIK